VLNRLIRCLADIKRGNGGFEQLPAAFFDPEMSSVNQGEKSASIKVRGSALAGGWRA
jgi:hypothetical protein